MVDLYKKLKQFNQNSTEKNPPTPEKKTETTNPSNEVLSIPGVMKGHELIGAIEKRDRDKLHFLLSIGVEERTNEAGSYGYRRFDYSPHSMHYSGRDIESEELVFHTQNSLFTQFKTDDLLFIDTETTGLAGGTGTVPFLIGAGHFDGSGFVVHQYLMRDYDEEEAVLQEINILVRSFSAVVSYNGKRFDIPLLRSRFMLNRMRSPLPDYPHLDLLYPVRRLWKEHLPDCRLSTVERDILGHTRKEDIPGELIPYVYFDFLRGIRIERMRPVLFHNAEDIYTLAMLTAKTCRMVRSPLLECQHGLELYGLGRYLAGIGEREKACRYLEESLRKDDLPLDTRHPIYRMLSILWKRMENYSKARDIWHYLITEYDDLFAHIELAKYLEHRLKHFEQALEYTQKAIEHLDQNPRAEFNTTMQRERLLYRQERLLKKIQGRKI